jgi:O-antigen/teichoic acid export membrane protein
LLNWVLVRRADPGVSLDWRQVKWARIQELGRFSFYAFLGRVGDSVRSFADPLIIGRLLTIGLITPFNVAARLMDHFRALIIGLVGPLMPRMSELEAQAKPDDLQRLFLRGSRAAALLSFFIGSLLFLNGAVLLQLWLGDRFLTSYPLLLVLMAGQVVALAQYPSTVLIYAKGRHRPLGWWTVAEGAANLGLSIYWAPPYGLLGVALGTTIPMLVIGLLVQPWYVLLLTGLSFRQYLKEALARPVLASTVFLALDWFWTRASLPTSIGLFILSLAWQAGLFAVLAYAFGLAPMDRQLISEHAKRLAGLAIRMART